MNVIAQGGAAKIRYFERQYPTIEIDSNTYSDVLICGIRYQLEDQRSYTIGCAMATSDENAWEPYVQSGKILINKTIGSWSSGWISIN